MMGARPVPEAAEAAAAIVRDLRAAWFGETRLQELLAEEFRQARWLVRREVRLAQGDRIDLLVVAPTGARIGIEVKVTGSLIAVVRQLQRYAHSRDIDALVLATTRVPHEAVPATLGDMPVLVARINGGAF